MPKTKVEVYDKNQLIYPFIESDHVTFSNGMKVTEMLDQSISMPAVTHEDLSFKVGVGDQDVSSAIVDSSVSEMTIKGKTYQNILPEPSTHVLSNSKEMFKVNEGLDPNVEIVDGVSKSAILSGQTLVNLATVNNYTHAGSSVNTTIVDSGSTIKVTINSDGSKVLTFKLTQQLKSNTKYMIVSKQMFSSNLRPIFSFYNGKDFACDYANPIKIGNKTILTTTDATNHSHLVYGVHGGLQSGDWFEINYPVLIEYQEGMENWDIPYFEGMQSVKLPVLTTYTNLFTGFITKGYIQNGEHVGATTDPNLLSDYIEIFAEHLAFRRFKKDGTPVNSFGEFAFYDADKNFIDRRIHKQNVDESVTVPENTKYIRIWSRPTDDGIDEIAMLIYSKEKPSTITEHQPCKTNILRTPEEAVLRSVENAQDTINLNTGEYVQRIGEVILNGSEPWEVLDNNTENTIGFTLHKVLPLRKTGDKYVKVNCDKLPSYKENLWLNDKIGCVTENNINQDLNDTQLQVRVLKSTLSTQDTNGFKSWLQTNPLTVQYILETPVIKTVDLSSSGNWEKVVLDGSEDEVWHNGDSSWANKIFRLDGARHTPNIMNSTNALVETGLLFSSHFEEKGMNHLCNVKPQPEGVSIYGDSIFVGSPQISTIGELRTWLSQNPITVWYQTQTHQDSTQVKQPIFFKDGHIQFSSGVDNSLIPTLDYQAKTSNSYVMDLMKTNTRYTMKAKSANGTFTIDGTSYNVGTNTVFTSPSSITNKFLVMSNKTNEEVMILEGDVVSKTIPYFKGIKSAFEDESQIEVLSTGKNWVNLDNARLNSNHQKVVTRIENGFNIKFTYNRENFAGWDNAIKIKVNVKPNTDYTVSLTKIVRKDPYGGMSPQPTWVTGYTWVRKGDSNNESFTERNLLDGVPTTMKFNSRDYDYVTLDICSTPAIPVQDGDFDIVDIQIEEALSATVYESYKSNSTKIPLLSPLRSLPNGVCDEVILDRENNKAKVIQRVGELDFSNLQYNTWIVSDSTLSKTVRFTWLSSNISFYKVKDSSDGICDSIPYIRYNSNDTEHCRFDGSNPSAFMIWVDKSKLTSFDDKGLKKYLSTLPSTRVQYELATPVITEVDLEGFPYIYKDGHIFLNGEIVPVTEITYSINQCQQISASNEDIIRHEKELTYLQKLIAQYVQVDYESVLLSLKV